MRRTPEYLLEDVEEVKRLIRENPWATIVATTAAGLVASHYPIVLEEDTEGISIVSHVGRPDEVALELGQGEVLVIVQGPHGYISPGWYDPDPAVPTWNHVTAHLYAVPEILTAEENYRVLGELVDHFEDRMPEPRRMEADDANATYARRISRGTVGLRLRVTRFDARLKLSQNRPAHTRDRIIAELEHGEHYANPALAAEMRRIAE
jgi:transcriptional regulator